MTFWKRLVMWNFQKLFKMEIGSKVGWCVMVSRGISWNTGSCLLQTCPTCGVKVCQQWFHLKNWKSHHVESSCSLQLNSGSLVMSSKWSRGRKNWMFVVDFKGNQGPTNQFCWVTLFFPPFLKIIISYENWKLHEILKKNSFFSFFD